MTANKEQVGGRHYADMAIQPFEYIHKNGIGFAEGSVIKYVSRWRKKGGIEDLKKARHVIDLLIEMERVVPAEDVAQTRAENVGARVEVKADTGGWLATAGPGCPVDSHRLVEVRFRDGSTDKDTAESYRWGWNGSPADIVAYRLL